MMAILVLTFLFLTICGFHRGLAAICLHNICEYDFHINHALTMTYKGRDVTLSGTQLYVTESDGRQVAVPAGHVMTADGFQRQIITINGQFPGPTIEVTAGAQVVVHVINHLSTSAVDIHWHGLHMRGTPWMDGASYVTQCPILPRHSFTYRFEATPAGNHWYHSHFASQRNDGLYGQIIIHRNTPLHPYTPLFISDWYHSEGHSYDAQTYNVDGEGGNEEEEEVEGVGPVGNLLNGRGRYTDLPFPVDIIEVVQGQEHRFPVASGAAEFAFEISIDTHRLTIHAMDGSPISPIDVDILTIHPGETYEFSIKATQPVGRYWLRAYRIESFPLQRGHGMAQAIISYRGATSTGDPTTNPVHCTPTTPCRIMNCPYPSTPERTCINVADARAENVEYNGVLNNNDYEEIFLNVGDNYGDSINGRSFVTPFVPLFQPDVPKMVDCLGLCNDPNDGCTCTHMLNLPFGKNIQIVISNLMPAPAGESFEPYVGVAHPIHIHGHTMAVLKAGLGQFNSDTGVLTIENPDVNCPNPLCKTPHWNGVSGPLNLDNPPLKDTVVVPPGGYVVLRLRADNPGNWFVHCHILGDLLNGMAMILVEGESRIPSPPKNMPTCSSFEWTADEYNRYLFEAYRLARAGPVPWSSWPKENENGVLSNLTAVQMLGVCLGCVVAGAIIVAVLILIHNSSCNKNRG